MNLVATYFAIGYVPMLAAKQFQMLAFASQFLDHPDEALRTVANGEFDRLVECGQAALSEQQLLRTISLADGLGIDLPPAPEDPNGFAPWLQAVQDGVRQTLETTADRPMLTMIHEAGHHAGSIIQTASQLAYVIRFLIANYSPALEARWDGFSAQLQQTIPLLQRATAHPGLPQAVGDLGMPFSNVVGDLMLFPKRCEDKPYLVLLGRNLQNEVYNLLDLIEATDELLAR